MNTCVWEFGGGCTKENKKELLRSQAARQGILVGVCIELSQFEGFLLAAIFASIARKEIICFPTWTSRLSSSVRG